MNNQLFIVCPFSNLEYWVKKQYGQDVLFLSVPAGLVPPSDDTFREDLKRIITENNITEIYVANEVSNPFIQSVIDESYKRDIALLNPVADLKEEFWMERFAGLSRQQQKLKLAELMIELSMEMLQTTLLSMQSSDLPIYIRGLVISKEAGFIKELKKMNRYKIAYGL